MVHSILITVTTSSSKLSKSGKDEFSVTLSATTDTDETIAIDPFFTMLDSNMAVFHQQGFTFKDAFGELAKRPSVHVCYMMGRDSITAASAIEIPPKTSKCPFIVTRTIRNTRREPVEPLPASPDDAEYKQLLEQLADETHGLELGCTYEIGLGNDWSEVSWWRPGRKGYVFWWNRTLNLAPIGQRLPLVLQNKAFFEVVE